MLRRNPAWSVLQPDPGVDIEIADYCKTVIWLIGGSIAIHATEGTGFVKTDNVGEGKYL